MPCSGFPFFVSPRILTGFGGCNAPSLERGGVNAPAGHRRQRANPSRHGDISGAAPAIARQMRHITTQEYRERQGHQGPRRFILLSFLQKLK